MKLKLIAISMLTISFTSGWTQKVDFRLSVYAGGGYTQWINDYYIGLKQADVVKSTGSGSNVYVEINPSIQIKRLGLGVVFGIRHYTVAELTNDFEVPEQALLRYDQLAQYGLSFQYDVFEKGIIVSPVVQAGIFNPRSTNANANDWERNEFFFMGGLKLTKKINQFGLSLRPNVNYYSMDYIPLSKAWSNRATSFNLDLGIEYTF